MSYSNNPEQVVILGGGYAGALAAIRLARKSRNLALKITLVDAGPGLVERIRLHQIAAGQKVTKIPYRELLDKTGVDFLQARVTSLDTQQQVVHLRQGETVSHIAYDRLIYALGSTIDTRSVPGVSDYAFSLSSSEASARLHDRLADLAATGGRVLVCGGGLTGIEAATEIAEAYPKLNVTLVTGDSFGSRLSKKGEHHLRRTFKRLGIKIEEHSWISRIEKKAAVRDDQSRLEFDLCLWAGSFTVSDIAREAGLRVNDRGQILVDLTMRALSHPTVYGVGDAAIIADGQGPSLRMSCATALPMGAHASDNIYKEIKGRSLKDFSFGYAIQCISLGRKDGLIQMVNSDDTPREKVITGRFGSWVKELVCRYPVWSIKLEKRGLVPYSWPRGEGSVGTKVRENYEY